jgi:hypothetical protein
VVFVSFFFPAAISFLFPTQGLKNGHTRSISITQYIYSADPRENEILQNITESSLEKHIAQL